MQRVVTEHKHVEPDHRLDLLEHPYCPACRRDPFYPDQQGPLYDINEDTSEIVFVRLKVA